MDRLGIGEYIRTKKGVIGQVIDTYTPSVKMQGNTTNYLVKWDCTKAHYISKMRDIKHSFNIIDLIEER